MSTQTVTEPARRRATASKVSLTGVLRSEMIRFFSLNSTRILVLVSIVVYVGIALMGTYGVGLLMQNMDSMGPMPGMGDLSDSGFMVETMASGIVFSQLILGVLGVLLFSGEYTTGSAVSTFLASPQRLRVMGAKTILIVVLTAVVQLISTLIAFAVCRPIAAGYDINIEFASDAFQRVLWYGTLSVVMAAVIGLALGGIIRNSAGGITSLVALFFVLPMIAAILLSITDWATYVVRFMPDQLGLGLALPRSYPSELDLWAQLVGVGAWIVIPLLLGAWLLKSRDIK